MNRLTDIAAAISHALHVVKPLVIELMIFAWAMVEIGKFMMSVVWGHGE